MFAEGERQGDFEIFGDAFTQITKLFDFLVCGVVLIDEASRRIVYANSVAKQLTQWEDTEMIGGVCHAFLCPAAADHCPLLDQHQDIEFDEKILTVKLGNHIPILKRVRRIQIEGCNYILESFTDIRKQKDRLLKLETLHETDTLTGLPNRASLERMVEDVLAKDINEEDIHSLIMVDLDLLKKVNDTYGHQAGDDVLREFGATLKESMRKVDVVFRWGVAQSRKGESFEKWFRRTDFCLSKAKRDGRNRVTDWESFVHLVWRQGEIPWINILESGNKKLDDEHRRLLKKINGLFGMMNPMHGNGEQKAIVDQFVADYKRHMIHEESLFQDTGFPLIDHHISEHVRIHNDLTEIQSILLNGSTDYFSIVDYVVREVFVYHMSMEDTKFFPYLKNRES